MNELINTDNIYKASSMSSWPGSSSGVNAWYFYSGSGNVYYLLRVNNHKVKYLVKFGESND